MLSRPIQVLLIEDDPADARLVELMLAEAAGASIELTTVPQLQSGLEHLAGDHVDAVLMDLTLTRGTLGLEAFSIVKGKAPTIPIILLTALADQHVAEAAIRKGATAYLVKGRVDGVQLWRTLQDAVTTR